MLSKPTWTAADRVHEVRHNVFFVEGTASNWVIMSSPSNLTLIDTGYPADRAILEESIRHAGHTPRDVKSIYVTHGHADHIGSAEYYRSTYGSTVYASSAEVPNVKRAEQHQVGLREAWPHLWNYRVSAWALHAFRSGGMTDVAVKEVRSFESGRSLDAPGYPIPVVVPGHTPGHTCYYLPETKIMVLGDAFVTGHRTSSKAGPQMLHSMFHSDSERAQKSLAVLAKFNVEVFLPGHGPLGTGPMSVPLSQLGVSLGN
jgi:glyoxylase-like metal-dependent hydrolase (beta-lactamase superfamily II)